MGSNELESIKATSLVLRLRAIFEGRENGLLKARDSRLKCSDYGCVQRSEVQDAMEEEDIWVSSAPGAKIHLTIRAPVGWLAAACSSATTADGRSAVLQRFVSTSGVSKDSNIYEEAQHDKCERSRFDKRVTI